MDPTAIEEIAKVKPAPHHLLVTVEGEDEPRRVAVPAVRKRWQRIGAVLEQLRWSQIECCDKAGATLAIVRAADESAPAELSRMPDAGGITVRERELMELTSAVADRAVQRALEAGDRAAARLERSLALVADAVAAQLEMMTASTRAIAAQYTEALTLQRQLTVSGATAEEGDGMAAIGPLLGLLARGRAAPAQPRSAPASSPKNGAPKATNG